jgi:hypothetical protein
MTSATSSNWRSFVAVLLALGLGVASGPVIVTRGFGAFPWVSSLRYGAFVYWFLCLVACPAVVALVADRWRLLLAPLASLVMTASLEYQSFRWHESAHGAGAWDYMKKDIELDIAMAAVALAASFLITYALQRIQRA